MTEQTKRPYRSPLRKRQARATRETILEAVAELIVTEGVEGFSMREVAERAGVSERTVYHHFPSRQALLDGLSVYVDEKLTERDLHIDPRDIESLPDRMSAIFRAFDEIGAPAEAMARIASAHGIRSVDHQHRTEAFRQRLADLLDPLPADEAARRFAVIRHLVSSTAWLALRDDLGLDSEDAAQAMAWALETLLDELGGG